MSILHKFLNEADCNLNDNCPYGYEITCSECISKMIKEHDAQVRTEVISEISREMRLLYGNAYEKQVRADAIEEFTNFYKGAVTENSVCKLSEKGVCVHEYCIDCYKDAYLQQLKEKQNG